jgi:hypothetical protein
MKFYTLSLATIVFVSISLTSCYKGVFGIHGKGSNVSEVRSVSGFDKIELALDAEVTYVQDTDYSVVVEAQSNILDVLDTDVSGSILKIDFHRNVCTHSKIKITIHSPEIKALTISGSGEISSSQPIVTFLMDLKISGSGKINLTSLTAETMSGTISGSGDITIDSGTVTDEVFSISGSGSIYTLEMVSQNSDTKISGSGSAFINVMQELYVKISGSGNVSYKGQPTVDTHISGSGDLIHL